MEAARPRRRRLRAALGWVVCLFGLTFAFDSFVLANDVGPQNEFVVVAIAAATLIGVVGAVGFWRTSGALGGRPRAAAALIVVAVVWAASSAYLIHWLIDAFNPG